MAECIFCRIAKREIPSQIVAETPQILAFRDIDPKAPVHLLIIPKAHVDSFQKMEEADRLLLPGMAALAQKLAVQEGVDQNGFRLVVNNGKDGGQAVGHLHLHLLGGRAMKWPPG